LFAAVVGLPGCEPEHRYSQTCSIELVDTGWHLDWEMPPEPRQNDAVGASYGVFAVSLPERTGDEVRERAAVLMSIIRGRDVSASDVTESSQPAAPSFRRFTSPGFLAEWEPESDYLEVFSNDASWGRASS